jgi:SAM-dependent methyltransferase
VREALAAGPGAGPRMRSPLPVSARVRWAWLQGLPLRRRRLRRILGLLEGRTPHSGTLVDVGGGTGVGTDAAVRTAPPGAYRVQIVLEPQLGMLRRGTLAHPDRTDIAWVRGSGSRLPLPNDSVDVVLSLGVLCCMRPSDVPPAVAELGRVVRPGGYCVLGVPRGWADYCEPLFRGAGFRQIRAQRPGRGLFQRVARAGNSGGDDH